MGIRFRVMNNGNDSNELQEKFNRFFNLARKIEPHNLIIKDKQKRHHLEEGLNFFKGELRISNKTKDRRVFKPSLEFNSVDNTETIFNIENISKDLSESGDGNIKITVYINSTAIKENDNEQLVGILLNEITNVGEAVSVYQSKFVDVEH